MTECDLPISLQGGGAQVDLTTPLNRPVGMAAIDMFATACWLQLRDRDTARVAGMFCFLTRVMPLGITILDLMYLLVPRDTAGPSFSRLGSILKQLA